ncbi:hypothetical protein THMIRHAM_16640 [Thiomicrorhabdus immobilis]|uniref:Uncharacterized protein n=1 Tax=Thiomicrorhabdus immobilis TaxID=2791037 RepID=A0ABN6CZ34_9GAMM|nr:hypothetical protein THMIRHAM_16640 [Thiomicrorhabdus immobilis]
MNIAIKYSNFSEADLLNKIINGLNIEIGIQAGYFYLEGKAREKEKVGL